MVEKESVEKLLARDWQNIHKISEYFVNIFW